MKSYKYRLELNNKQKMFASKHAGVARHAYNWGVSLCKEKSENKDKLPSAIDLHKLLVKDVKSENKWYYDVSKCSPQQSLRNLNTSWTNYFRKLKNGEIEKSRKFYIKECKRKKREINTNKFYDIGKPKFKKKGEKDSFYLEGNIKIKNNKIKVPKFGWIKISENLEEEFFVKNVVISRHANHWFISFKREKGDLRIKNIKNKPTVGVDLGVKTLATLSDGKTFDSPKAFKKNKRRLKLAQRKVSKKFNEDKKIQSNNYYKAQKKVACIHYNIYCLRKDATHKLTTYLAKNHSLISIEDLNVSGMMKNKYLANAIQDGGFYEFRRQLEYKTNWYGSELFVIDRFFPSSKRCSRCKNIKHDLKLSDRIYHCDKCGLKIDRDLNGSINIEDFAVSSTVNACGELNKPADLHQKELVETGNKQQMSTFV